MSVLFAAASWCWLLVVSHAEHQLGVCFCCSNKLMLLLLLVHVVAAVALYRLLYIVLLSVCNVHLAARALLQCVAVIVHALSNALLTIYCPICDKLQD